MKAYDGAVKQLSGQVTRAENCTDVVSNVQLHGVQLYAVPDHVVHGKRQGSHRKCSTRLEYEGVATSLSDVFPKSDARLVVLAVLLDNEQYGGRGCLGEGFTRRSLREFQREQGLRDRVLVLRETESIRMSQETEGHHDKGQSKGSTTGDNKGRSRRELKFECQQCGKFGLGMYSREASAFEASERGLAETRFVDMARVDLNALEIGSVLLPGRKSQGSDWNRLVCCSDCALEDGGGRFSNAPNTKQSEKLQIRPDFGSECSRGQRQGPRCVTLVRESETGRCAEF